ncbi:MAG: RNA-binding cell elongation regulator Jag/EloR [Christensenellales bacterium]
MNKQEIEASGRSMDEAVANGLNQLGLSADEVEIEVLQEPTRGIFGIGGRDCIVKLTKKATLGDLVSDFILGLCEKMNVEASLDIQEEEEAIHVNISGPHMGVLIGHRGETLDAIQYLTNLVVSSRQRGVRVLVDTENYRQKRQASLERLALKLAAKVKATGRPVKLEPMTPYERRILHATLQDSPHVVTNSEGNEPNRRVIISSK